VLAPWALPSAHLIFDIHRWQLTAAGAPPSTAPQTRSPYPSFSFVVSCSGSSRPPFVSSFQESTSSWRRHVLPVRCMPRRAQSQIQANDRAPGALRHPRFIPFHSTARALCRRWRRRLHRVASGRARGVPSKSAVLNQKFFGRGVFIHDGIYPTNFKPPNFFRHFAGRDF
jgi:hypothetical protein